MRRRKVYSKKKDQNNNKLKGHRSLTRLVILTPRMKMLKMCRPGLLLLLKSLFLTSNPDFRITTLLPIGMKANSLVHL